MSIILLDEEQLCEVLYASWSERMEAGERGGGEQM